MNKKYWYKYYYSACPIPGCDFKKFVFKERRHTKKPTEKDKRVVIYRELCGCLDSLTPVELLEMGG